MRVRKSEIKEGVLPKVLKKIAPQVAQPKDRTDEILNAIKDNKPEPVVVEQKMPQEIMDQQKQILDEVSKKPELPTYHFKVNRNSQGFIKDVVASPVASSDKDTGNIAESWYSK